MLQKLFCIFIFKFYFTTVMAQGRAVAQAARSGEISVLGNLLRSGHDYSGKDSREFTPLHEAAKAGHLECVKLIVGYAKKDLPQKSEFLSRVRVLDGGFDTPLSIAASHGCWRVVEHLADWYVGLTAFETGYALWKACKNDHTKCVEVLLQKFSSHWRDGWAEVRLDEFPCTDSEEVLPIHLTVSNGNIKATKLLLQSGADVDQIRSACAKTPLHFAACSGCSEMIELLLLYGANPNAADNNLLTPLHAAAKSCNLRGLQLILEAIHRRTGEHFLARYVLQLSRLNSTPLSLGVENGNPAVMTVLLYEALLIDPWSDEKNISNYGHDTEFLLHKACKTNCIDVIDQLVRKLPQLINKPDDVGDFPIHVAARFCSEVALKRLVEAGANIYVKSQIGGWTVLHAACLNNHHDLIPYIVTAFRHDINAACSEGLSSLQRAALCCNLRAIKSLLAHGAELIMGRSNICSCAILACVAHIENIKTVPEKELQYHGPKAVLHAAVCRPDYVFSSDCLEYLLRNGIPTFSSKYFSESSYQADKGLYGDTYPDFSWDVLPTLYWDPISGNTFHSSKEYNISKTIKILLEYGTPFCDWVKARGKVEGVYVFGDWRTSNNRYINKNNLEVFLNYGMAELQHDCQSFPDISKLFTIHGKLKDLYIARNGDRCDVAEALLKMEMYMRHFPFAKFSNAEERLVLVQKFLNGRVVQSIPTLKNMCRWTVRCCFVRKHGAVCIKHVDTLPLPKTLKDFLTHQII